MTNAWYLSGPMSGYTDFNFPLFHRVAAAFRRHGVAILNPAELTPADTTWENAMAWDLAALPQACGVILLPGWEFSSGARLEWFWARALGLPRLPIHVAWALLIGSHKPMPNLTVYAPLLLSTHLTQRLPMVGKSA